MPRWNGGYYFSRCGRCACDILRRPEGRWKRPPRGFRVAWKPLGEGDVNWDAWERALAAGEHNQVDRPAISVSSSAMSGSMAGRSTGSEASARRA